MGTLTCDLWIVAWQYATAVSWPGSVWCPTKNRGRVSTLMQLNVSYLINGINSMVVMQICLCLWYKPHTIHGVIQWLHASQGVISLRKPGPSSQSCESCDLRYGFYKIHCDQKLPKGSLNGTKVLREVFSVTCLVYFQNVITYSILKFQNPQWKFFSFPDFCREKIEVPCSIYLLCSRPCSK